MTYIGVVPHDDEQDGGALIQLKLALCADGRMGYWTLDYTRNVYACADACRVLGIKVLRRRDSETDETEASVEAWDVVTRGSCRYMHTLAESRALAECVRRGAVAAGAKKTLVRLSDLPKPTILRVPVEFSGNLITDLFYMPAVRERGVVDTVRQVCGVRSMDFIDVKGFRLAIYRQRCPDLHQQR